MRVGGEVARLPIDIEADDAAEKCAVDALMVGVDLGDILVAVTDGEIEVTIGPE